MEKKITVVYSTRKIDDSYTQKIMHTSGLNKGCEILAYENQGTHSLSEIYNQALAIATNNIVVFLHDDIVFKTPNWGRTLLNAFNTTDYGILGVAGVKDKFPASACWWEDRTKMVGTVDHTDGTKEWTNQYSNEPKGKIVDVIAIDGLFMAVHRDRIEHGFDEEFDGFHFYDMGFCFPNYLDGVNIGVVNNIRLLHLSVGQTNKKWDDHRKLFVSKYWEELPYESE